MKKFLLPLAYAILPTFCYSSNPSNILISGHIGYPFAIGDNAYHFVDTSANFRLAYDLKTSYFLSKKISVGLFYGSSYLHRSVNIEGPQAQTGIAKIRTFFHQFDVYANYEIPLTKNFIVAPQLGFGFSYDHTNLESNISIHETLHTSGFNILSGISMIYQISPRLNLEAQGNYSFNKMNPGDAEHISYSEQAQIITTSLGVAYRL